MVLRKFILYFSEFPTNLCEFWKFDWISGNLKRKTKLEKWRWADFGPRAWLGLAQGHGRPASSSHLSATRAQSLHGGHRWWWGHPAEQGGWRRGRTEFLWCRCGGGWLRCGRASSDFGDGEVRSGWRWCPTAQGAHLGISHWVNRQKDTSSGLLTEGGKEAAATALSPWILAALRSPEKDKTDSPPWGSCTGFLFVGWSGRGWANRRGVTRQLPFEQRGETMGREWVSAQALVKERGTTGV
jgi:hypothetical protein